MDIRGGNFARQEWHKALAERAAQLASHTNVKDPYGASTGKGFLDLPPELREQIYSYLVIKDQATVTMLFDFHCYVNHVSAHQPAITQVSRLIRQETLPMFYSANLFTAQLDQVDDLLTAKRWLRAIGNDNIKNLKRICLCGWTKIAFGHMLSRRFVRVELNLWDGGLHFGDGEDGHPEVAKRTESIKQAFKEMVQARQKEPYVIDFLTLLMEGFNRICTTL